MKQITDVIIVGAGVIGCSAALFLARFGGIRVTVIEKGSIASGMTKRSGALVRALYPSEGETRLSAASLPYFQNWEERVGGKCAFVKTGLVILPGDTSGEDRVKRQVSFLNGRGVQAQLLDRDQIIDIEPAARVDAATWAVYEPGAGFVDPIAATQSLAARARELGVVFKTGALVKSILVEHGRVAGVDTTTGPVEALTVVIAAGVWADRLLQSLRLQIGIEPARSEVAFFQRPPELKTGHVAFIDQGAGVFFRPHSFGLTFGSLIAPAASEPANPDQFEETVAPNYVDRVQRLISARLPAMAQARFVRGHVGINDMTGDGLPVIDRVPHLPGLFLAAGFSGTGFALAPAVGMCITELVTDGLAKTADLTPFALNRFEQKGNHA